MGVRLVYQQRIRSGGRKIEDLPAITDTAEKELEEQRIISALEQAIESATNFKLNKIGKQLKEELEKVKPPQEE